MVGHACRNTAEKASSSFGENTTHRRLVLTVPGTNGSAGRAWINIQEDAFFAARQRSFSAA
jgi:hypothetical protein